MLRVALALLVGCMPAYAFWQTRDSAYNSSGGGGGPPAACTPTCVGDLSLTSVTWKAWYSTGRCFAHAYNGFVMDVVDIASGGNVGTRLKCGSGVISEVAGASCTFVISGPHPNLCSPLATTCAVSGGCEIAQWYDQTRGIGDIKAPIGGRRALSTGFALNSNHCVYMDNIDNSTWASPAFTLAQPFSTSVVAKEFGTPPYGAIIPFFGSVNGLVRTGIDTANPANHKIYAGSIPTAQAETNSTFHAFNDVFDDLGGTGGSTGTSASIQTVDGVGTGTIIVAGTTGFATTSLGVGRFSDATFLGYVCEAGLASGHMSDPDIATLQANQHAAYGTW